MQRLDLTIVNIVDVETTCWERNPPADQEQEIIEIGVCTLNVATPAPLAHESLIVKPQRSSVSDFCTRLTTLTPEQVEQGIPFVDACALLQGRYQSKRRVWMSYGDFDRLQFERQCRSFGVEYPFGRRHLNVKNWVALSLGLRREVGMAEALDLLKLPLLGTHHRGGDDARNIACIASALLRAGRDVVRAGS